MEAPKSIPALGHFPKEPVTTGTTLVVVECENALVVGTDSRTSAGTFIASRATEKITPITEHIVVCRSGVMADTQAITEIVSFYVETYSTMEKKPLSLYRTAQLFRNYLYEYREQLSGAVIIAGFNQKEGAQIYEIPHGGLAIRRKFTATGSGSGFIHGFLDQQWKPDLTLEETKQMVKMSVGLAIMRDGSSGGVIRLAILNKDGTHRELYKPHNFPTVHTPLSFSIFPKHCQNDEPGAEGGGANSFDNNLKTKSAAEEEESEESSEDSEDIADTSKAVTSKV